MMGVLLLGWCRNLRMLEGVGVVWGGRRGCCAKWGIYIAWYKLCIVVFLLL